MDELEARREELVRHRENKPRLASAFGVYTSTGQGSVQFARMYEFGLTYVEQPRMHYGSVIDLDDLGDKLDHAHGECPPLPHCTGIVADWERDHRGFYVGAWLAARVSFPIEDLVPVTLKVQVAHHFTFSGMAMKDVPPDQRD